MASSSCASTSSASSHRPFPYDVFINFRGSDTRTNFVSLLYKDLTREGIHAFRDSEELWEGEEICPSLLRGIRGSNIAIPVFSKNYAESKYCLLELAEIWECHLSNGQTILPVFIDVEPRDVRHQTGSFGKPFQEHQRKYKSADLESWKNALKEVGNLKGWDLQADATIEDQSNVVELIVQRVLREPSSSPLGECKYPVGVDSHIVKLRSLLNIDSNGVRFVAICGMGGLGKTTIAKAVYNCIFKSFNGSSFLANVREEALQGDKGLVSLQNQLLKDILKRDHEVRIVSQGSELIKRLLHGKKVLLILDDVDDYLQLDVLAGGVNWFGQGSRVIITTRDAQSLIAQQVDKDIQIYKPEKLDFENSLQLLSLYAFSKNEPPEKYKQLSHEIINYAGGLPLTLEVLGSFLFGKDKEEWEDTLEGLKDILYNKVSGMPITSLDEKVYAKLMISYNKLSDHAKIIFLDIACHFIGWKEEAISIWEACELRPRLAINELIQKHLLKIDTNGRLRMHDNACNFIGWKAEEAISIWEACELRPKLAIKELIQKHLLKIDTNGRLRMHDQLQFMGKRIISKDSHGDPSKRSRLWSSEMKKVIQKNTRFKKLKVLILHECKHLSRSPDFFSWFPCLQRLDLTKCSSLVELRDSICELTSLKRISLEDCLSITKLPMSIGNLKHLVELVVSGTKIEELPDGVGQLEKLEKLDASYCQNLVRLPTSMGRLGSLLHLYLEETMIEKLPDDFSKLLSLEDLTMSMVVRYDQIDYKRLQPLPISMSANSRLQKLYLKGDRNLQSLAVLPPTLIRGKVELCISLQICSDLSSVEIMEKLLIYDKESLERLPDLSSLKRLISLDLSGCENLEEIQGLQGTESLKKLEANGCHKLTELMNFSKLKGLVELVIDSVDLENLEFLEGTESLEVLILRSCPKLTELSDLSNLKRLKRLVIGDCENVVDIHCIEEMESLEHLMVEGCHKLRELPDMPNLKRLEGIFISDCVNLEKIHPFEGVESVGNLSVLNCYKLTETPRKIHGQGRLLVDNVGKGFGQGTNSVGTDDHHMDPGSALFCIVLAFTSGFGPGSEGVKFVVGERVTITFVITAAIRWGGNYTPAAIRWGGNYWNSRLCYSIRIEDIKSTERDINYIDRFKGFPLRLVYSIRIEDIEFTERDIIYIDRFKGFDWFPLDGKPFVEELHAADVDIFRHSDSCHYTRYQINIHVKHWKVLFENVESGQQMPNKLSSAMLVADFFRWEEEEGTVKETEEAQDVDNDEEVEERDADNCGEQVEEKDDSENDEEDNKAGGSGLCNCIVSMKAVWDGFCNCFSRGFLRYVTGSS